MMEKQLIPAGYKQTEVGVIPEDWDVKSLGELVSISSGESPSKYNFIGDGVPYFKVEQLNNGIKYAEITEYYFESGATVPEGSVIFPKRGASILLNKIRILKRASFMDTNLMTLTTNVDLFNEFLFYFLNSKGLDSVSDTTSIPQINNKHIKPFLIPLPVWQEQTAIANALSDVDALIAALEKLINKKSAIKTAAMQQLLTGKKRLPPFDQLNTGYKQTELGEIPGDWEVCNVGENCDLLTGYPFPSSKYSDHGVRLLRGSNVKRGNTDWDESTTQYWPEITMDINQYELSAGDIVISMDGSLVGRSFAQLADSDLPALLLQRVARLRSSKISVAFLKEWICSKFFTEHCDSVKTVTAIPHISPEDIRIFKFLCPTLLEEQTAIANVLSDMDKDLDSLQQRLHKTQQIKQGMMQELLTGKTRLI
jgi:type I restriction enzyme S subunit